MASSRCCPMLSAGCLLWWHPHPQSMAPGSVMGFCLKEAVSSDLWISLTRSQVMKSDLLWGTFSGTPWGHIAESLPQNRKACNHWASAISSLDVSLTTALFSNWTWPGVSPADTLNSLYLYKRNGHAYCTGLERCRFGWLEMRRGSWGPQHRKGHAEVKRHALPHEASLASIVPGLGLAV